MIESLNFEGGYFAFEQHVDAFILFLGVEFLACAVFMHYQVSTRLGTSIQEIVVGSTSKINLIPFVSRRSDKKSFKVGLRVVIAEWMFLLFLILSIVNFLNAIFEVFPEFSTRDLLGYPETNVASEVSGEQAVEFQKIIESQSRSFFIVLYLVIMVFSLILGILNSKRYFSTSELRGALRTSKGGYGFALQRKPEVTIMTDRIHKPLFSKSEWEVLAREVEDDESDLVTHLPLTEDEIESTELFMEYLRKK